MSSCPLETTLGKAIALRQKNAIPTLDLLESSPLSAPDVFSNDYLSLTVDPSLRAAALKRLSETDHILGSSGARVMHGNTSVHVDFESCMRDFFGAPAALLCNSGFDANVAFWRSIPQRGGVIIIDGHASCCNGMADCRAKDWLHFFPHNSASELANSSFDDIDGHAGSERRERLRRIAEYLRQVLEKALKHVPPNLLLFRAVLASSSFPREIVSLIFLILTRHPTLLATYLRQFGYAFTAVSYPATPHGEERIGIIVHAANRPEELRELVDHMLRWAVAMQGLNVQPHMPYVRSRL